MKEKQIYLTKANIKEMLENFYKHRDKLLMEFIFAPFFEAL